jgi:hypothetical protein
MVQDVWGGGWLCLLIFSKGFYYCKESVVLNFIIGLTTPYMMQSDTGYICTRMAIFTMDCNQSCQKNHIGILLLYLEYLRLYIYDTVYLVSEYVLIHT